MLNLPAVWADDCLRHEPMREVWVGVPLGGTELPERATILRDAVRDAGARIVPAAAHTDDVLASVHAPELLAHLSSVHAAWLDAGFVELAGQDRVVPYVFPTDAMLDGLPVRQPAAIHARAGRYCYDTMTLVGPGTWEAARAAVDAAQTAADLVAAGEPAAYAICRPPGTT